MKIKKMLTQLVSWLFIGFCASGLLWQLISITDKYFRYHVVSSTIVFTPDVTKPLAMAVCVDLASIIDYKRMNRDFKTSYYKKATGLVNININNLTIKTLFDYTPSNDSILKKFSYKSKGQTKLTKVDKNVNDHVDVVKFLQRSYVCYKITLKNHESFSYREVSVSNYYQFTIKDYFFNQNIANTTEVKLMLCSVNHLPYKEMISTQFQNRPLVDFSRKNMYRSNHMTIQKTSLESPYETNCKAYRKEGFYGRDHCVDECIASNVWNTFRKASLFQPVSHPSHAFPFTRKHLKNGTTFTLYSNIQTNCESVQCGKQECHDKEIVTSTDVTFSNLAGKGLRWIHKVSSQISFEINSTPSLSFVEFIIFILGSISTWTGLSVTACNPVVLAQSLSQSLKPRLQEIKKRSTDSAKRRQRIIWLHERRQRMLALQVAQKFNSQFVTKISHSYRE